MSDRTESTGDTSWDGVDRRRPHRAIDWQSALERDKAAIARNLHDHSGGLLAAAIMDVTWSQMHLGPEAVEIKSRLTRAHAALNVAISLNRRMIEELRPTLLDNFGLVAALRWHFTGACEAAGIRCDQHYPDPPPRVMSRAAIGLYRIAESVLSLMIAHETQHVDVTLTVRDCRVALRMQADGMPRDCTLMDENTREAISSVSSRIQGCGGSMAFQKPPRGATFEFELPDGISPPQPPDDERATT